MGKPTVGITTDEMRIVCMGKNAHNIRGKRILCMGKPTMGMPTEEMRILCMGKNAHNVRGNIMHGRTHSGHKRNTHFMRGQKCAYAYVGKPTHNMHGKTHGGNAHA